MSSNASDVTAYAETGAELGRQVREARIDHSSFETPLRACDLRECRATCCHDGAVLTQAEADGMTAALRLHRSQLESYGVDTSAETMVCDRERKAWRTAVRESSSEERAEEFPPHFPKTRCVYLDEMHRCAWQRLAMDLGKPAWFYKPIACWMHPLTVKQVEGRPTLMLPSKESDPHRRADYPGFAPFTPCGKVCATGRPAREVLEAELQMLSALSGRDLRSELNAPSAGWRD